MNKKYKIILDYINDLSVEIKDPEALLIVKERILKFNLDLEITSKPLKNKMIEVNTKLIYQDKEAKKREAYFEMVYATVVKLDESIENKKELEKIILCDVQKEIYPKIEKIFIETIKNSGLPGIEFKKKIDFDKLYYQKLN
tara:strand:- start:257 stop:679 length:423 start_codon:yes stop_codon:yes gene_type:complete